MTLYYARRHFTSLELDNVVRAARILMEVDARQEYINNTTVPAVTTKKGKKVAWYMAEWFRDGVDPYAIAEIAMEYNQNDVPETEIVEWAREHNCTTNACALGYLILDEHFSEYKITGEGAFHGPHGAISVCKLITSLFGSAIDYFYGVFGSSHMRPRDVALQMICTIVRFAQYLEPAEQKQFMDKAYELMGEFDALPELSKNYRTEYFDPLRSCSGDELATLLRAFRPKFVREGDELEEEETPA